MEVREARGFTPRRRLNFLTSPTGTHYTDRVPCVNNFLQEISNVIETLDRHPEAVIT
jgi:hypothetical protein